jgi:hypothetical protein
MYFKRDAYDPSVVSEAQTRLASFQGATAISSNQYFGRDEEQELEMQGGAGGLLSEPGSNMASVETAARELVGKVLANPDVQNVGESIRSGALKVRYFGCCLNAGRANKLNSCLIISHKCLSRADIQSLSQYSLVCLVRHHRTWNT